MFFFLKPNLISDLTKIELCEVKYRTLSLQVKCMKQHRNYLLFFQ